MNAAIAGHLRMKRGGKHRTLAHRDDVPRRAGQHLHTVTDSLNPWRPDEHRAHRIV